MKIFKRMSVRTKVYGFIGLILLLAAGGYFLGQRFNLLGRTSQAHPGAGSGSGKADDPAVVPVELAEVIRGEIASYVTGTANLRALREVDIAAQTEGVTKQVLVEEGDFVKEGQVLCLLDDAQLRIRRESAEQRLSQAKIQLEKARIRHEKTKTQIRNSREDLGRLEKLYADKLVSEREIAQVKYKIDELQHDERVSASEISEITHRVDELESEIEQINLELSRTQIKAPFSGYIVQRMVDLGQTVRNLQAVFKLADFSPLYADVHLSEREAQQVRPGQTATIRLGVNEAIQVSGRVARLSPVVDQATGTVKATVEVNRAGGEFKPGAFVRVGIQTDKHGDAVLIPKRAVVEQDGEKFVFVVEGDTAKRTKVNLGYENGGQVEVLNGVSIKQQVVVAGQGALKDGSKVKVMHTRSQHDSPLRVAL